MTLTWSYLYGPIWDHLSDVTHHSRADMSVPLLVGQRLLAQDRRAGWYQAKLVAQRGENEGREVLVHFIGYKSSQDEWVPVGEHQRFRPEAASVWDDDTGCIDGFDEQYEVENILRRRKVRGRDEYMYLVRWAGWGAEYDSWEPAEVRPPQAPLPSPHRAIVEPSHSTCFLGRLSCVLPVQPVGAPLILTIRLTAVWTQDIDPELIEAFEDEAVSDEHAVPYVIGAADVVLEPNIADRLINEWCDDVCRKAAHLLARQREEWACRRLFEMSPCPAWVFCALQRAFSKKSDAAEAVSDIYSTKGARGGKFIADGFDIVSTDLVSELVGPFNRQGHGALVVRPNNTAVMLVPPLEFVFKTQRGEDPNGRTWPTQLIVTGHFMCLVDRGVRKSPRWAFDDERATYEKENKLAYKKAVAAAVATLPETIVLPARVTNFLALLL